jgi:hypothetical protein
MQGGGGRHWGVKKGGVVKRESGRGGAEQESVDTDTAAGGVRV